MEKLLKLYTYVDGGAKDTPFPNADGQIEIGEFRYDAKRMGGAPTITASVMYETCLDDVWTETVYAEFNGEKYYLKQTPTSSYSNEDERYKHELELVSERVILDNVYFYDAVVGDVPVDDKPVSNSTKFVFWGDIYEFANRLKASLAYSGLDYDVVVDKEIVSEEKLVSFEDTFFSNAIQEAYNTYDVPYYFDGKTIHFGYTNSVPTTTFKYGVDDSLLSITKTNANYKVVNRVTGTGSSDNIPYYYPNNSPKGIIDAVSNREDLVVTIANGEDFADKVAIDGEIKYEAFSVYDVAVTTNGEAYASEAVLHLDKIVGSTTKTFDMALTADNAGVFAIDLDYAISNVRNPIKGSSLGNDTITCRFSVDLIKVRGEKTSVAKSVESGTVEIPITMSGSYVVRITMEFASKRGDSALVCDYALSYSYDGGFTGWTYDGDEVSLSDLGLAISGTPKSGDTITQKLVKYVKTSENLMPSIYRETDAAERFYNATNDTYTDEDGNEVVYANPYVAGKPKEHIITVDDLKPSIKETVNAAGLRMDMFSEFAYDDDDNDETVEDEEGNRDFVHSYFFAKLRKLDFNLFDHAIENQPMTISFTSGACGACNFEIGVTEEFPQLNPVQVNADGTLKRDENGRVICGQFAEISEDECQPEQQDTINHEVWIALKKEEDTYGILMPKAPTKDANGNEIGGHRPRACTSATANDGDTFVILGINLPQSYVLNAEKKLEAEIIKYMAENNTERFNFTIGFSRIYFEENPDVLEYLNENSRLEVEYNGKAYTLYVNSFSYQMSEGDVLPQITVELDEELTIAQNALQNAINSVKSEVGKALSNIDILALSTPYFLRKDADDEAQGKINFKKGVKFGEGGKVEVFGNNSAKLTIEYLEVTKKASFTSLEIQEKTHVGGQMLITPAAINCGEVEELDDVYRCYFQTKGEDGDEIFNQFAVGDQAICQTFNAWGSKYYWRLVTGIGEDYIDLSKTDCDEDSDAPSEGDKIIQLGNREDEERQNAIVLAAYGDGSPYIIQYKGINAFELPEEKVVSKLSSTENVFTGKVHMEMGSDGMENLDLNIGAENLLRNSGFTGDYLSEPLADATVMEATKELYSAPLDHWMDEDEDSIGATVVELPDIAASGYGVTLSGTSARLYQTLYYDLIGGETYTVSFKAKGVLVGEETDAGTGEVTKIYNTIECLVGNASEVVSLTDEWSKYCVKVKPTGTSKVFSLSCEDVTICDIQLERGTIATAWKMSTLDNSSDRAYYQSMKYMAQALEEEAIAEGATDVLGGLILTNHIKVGNYADHKMIEETGGMSGSFTDYTSPFLWGGGTFDVALTTIAKYSSIESVTPEGEIPFAVTHGGLVILNNAVVRGTVYATDGKFTGEVEATSGTFNNINIVSGTLAGFKITENTIGTGENKDASFDWYVSGTEFFRVNSSDSALVAIRNDHALALSVSTYGSDGRAIYISANGGALAIESYGNIKLRARHTEHITINGLVLNCRVVTDGVIFTNDDIIKTSSDVTLPSNTVIGKVVYVKNTSTDKISVNGFTLEGLAVRMYFFDGNDWIAAI